MTLRQVYAALYRTYGPQHWWPGETPFEVMVGAVLTQNTAWSNVEKAIVNLKTHDALDPAVITHTPARTLAAWLKPSGYFNIKARRLKNFCAWYLAAGGLAALQRLDTATLRRELLRVNGVGPETADDILLYAFQRPVFVIDAYTRRLFSRLQLIDGEESYEVLRHYCEKGLGRATGKVALFNEYHALIVAHAKSVCRKTPLCAACCLRRRCPLGHEILR
ncbi:MAG: endonuclease [Gammaproteobacteria bacterium HGW-Gammaproteobacteria-1]|jgi:endonuclease-3 related protein|nr:MAG: endonuclease [Gammaproteobacteria bacterium HGW-Gammaproteobacteria-1]